MNQLGNSHKPERTISIRNATKCLIYVMGCLYVYKSCLNDLGRKFYSLHKYVSILNDFDEQYFHWSKYLKFK